MLLISGLLHLSLTPAHMEEAAYLGVLFGIEFVGAVIASLGIYWNRHWGWWLGATITLGSIIGYIAIGTIGLPIIGTESLWGATGIFAKVTELSFTVLAIWYIYDENEKLKPQLT